MSWLSDFIFGTPPTPPNPMVTSALQTSSNVNTAVAGSYLNNMNQVSPYGTLSYDKIGDYSWTDPTGVSYSVPRMQATQTMAPYGTPQWGIQQNQLASQHNTAEAAKQATWDIWGLLRDPWNALGSNPYAAGDPNTIGNEQYLTSFGATPGQQFGIGDAGAITRSYGAGDFSQDRQRVEDSLMSRMDPQIQRDEMRLQQQLADQGIRYGSEAYNDAMQQLTSQRTDARFAAINQAGQEQQRMMDMAAKRAGFENAAQQQAYTEMLQSGQFYNQAQRDTYMQQAQRGEFYNAGLAQNAAAKQQAYAADNQARSQWLNEQYQQRNQKFNELAAVQSGTQIQQPNFVNTANSQIANTDVAGLMNTRFNQELSNYQQSSNQFNQLMGGIFGMIGGIGKGAMMSDRREKKDIKKMGTVFAAGEEGSGKLPIYSYTYKDDPTQTKRAGPMAQDVEKIDKKAVKNIGGVKHIDVTRMGSILRGTPARKAA